MRKLNCALQSLRWEALYSIREALHLPWLAIAELGDIPDIAEGVCYEYKTPLLGWLPDGLPILLREMDAAAREYWD
jgi:hypothetical protein